MSKNGNITPIMLKEDLKHTSKYLNDDVKAFLYIYGFIKKHFKVLKMITGKY